MPRSSVKVRPKSSYGLAIWIILVLLRLFNAALVKTYFDPDEYWQSIEIAHLNVFHYGWKTWEWSMGLRSCLFLMPFIVYYRIIKLLELDTCDSYIVIRLFVTMLDA